MHTSLKLFIGVHEDRALTDQLSQLSSDIKTLYFSSREPLLERKEIEGKIYLGKPVSEPVHHEALELLSLNILSILKKILPQFSLSHEKLIVSAYSEHHE
ncbi:MAG: hypothetical protein Tsb0021_15900 [Chlamydiales bacterium]